MRLLFFAFFVPLLSQAAEQLDSNARTRQLLRERKAILMGLKNRTFVNNEFATDCQTLLAQTTAAIETPDQPMPETPSIRVNINEMSYLFAQKKEEPQPKGCSCFRFLFKRNTKQ